MFLSIFLYNIGINFVVFVGCSKICTVSIRSRPGFWEDPSQPKTKQDRCLKEVVKTLYHTTAYIPSLSGVSSADLAVLRILPR